MKGTIKMRQGWASRRKPLAAIAPSYYIASKLRTTVGLARFDTTAEMDRLMQRSLIRARRAIEAEGTLLAEEDMPMGRIIFWRDNDQQYRYSHVFAQPEIQREGKR